jgi:predicted small lipoprotein YifL
MRLIGLVALAIPLALLAGCGRLGPPRPPGPAEAITFPRAYPALSPEERERTAARLRARGQPVPPALLR